MELTRSLRTGDGAVLGYQLWRPGPPRPVLVLLHGVASNLTRWSEFVVATSLKSSWDLLRVDLRGNGRSLHRGRLDMARWCADLEAILDAESYPRAVLAGHCFGANVAVEFASRYAARTTGLVLIEPMLPEALTGHLRRVARLRPLVGLVTTLVVLLNAVGLYRRHLPSLDLEALDRETRMVAAAQPTADLRERYASPLIDLRTTPTATYLQSMKAVSGRLPDLAALTVPILALLSTGGAFSDPAITERRLARLPRCQIVRLPAQHWIPTECPTEMRQAIEEWCAALGSCSRTSRV
jgi:pimeloyl-ACP methyl ester carboxylesterase